jgi:hypothetical protein
LFVKVPEDDALDCDRCRSNGLPTKKSRHCAKQEAADGAEVVAAAPPESPAVQRRAKSGAMAKFMVTKMGQLVDHVWRSPSSEPSLGSVNANRPMLPGVINFHHPVAECLASFEPRYNCHAPTSHPRLMSAMGRLLPQAKDGVWPLADCPLTVSNMG